METEWNEQEMQDFIREAYEQNFDLLRIGSGVSLSPEVKQAGLQQVLFYWQKMREVALNVTETEVRLSLPSNESPKERIFGIEGVVDIVREGGKTIIYDIKHSRSRLCAFTHRPLRRSTQCVRPYLERAPETTFGWDGNHLH